MDHFGWLFLVLILVGFFLSHAKETDNACDEKHHRSLSCSEEVGRFYFIGNFYLLFLNSGLNLTHTQILTRKLPPNLTLTQTLLTP